MRRKAVSKKPCSGKEEPPLSPSPVPPSPGTPLSQHPHSGCAAQSLRAYVFTDSFWVISTIHVSIQQSVVITDKSCPDFRKDSLKEQLC